MMAAGSFLRSTVYILLIVATHGYPMKGSQTSTQTSSGGGGSNYAAYHRGGPSLASAPYSAVGDPYGSTYDQGPSVYPPVVMMASQFGGSGSSLPVGGPGAGVLSTGGPGAAGLSAMGAPTSAGLSSAGGPVGGPGATGLSGLGGSGLSGAGGPGVAGMTMLGGPGAAMASVLPGAAYVAGPVVYEPAGDSADSQDTVPATQWTVPTTVFSDSMDLGDILPPAPAGPQGPILRSGETSNVVKEAELGNYQQQTEEFGYPAEFSGSGPVFGQGLAPVLVPGVQLGGLRPAPSVRFDQMLLYGLYPPGSYSTFSQNHEAGKDYSQDVHYLKEHVTESLGSGQQKKFFQSSM